MSLALFGVRCADARLMSALCFEWLFLWLGLSAIFYFTCIKLHRVVLCCIYVLTPPFFFKISFILSGGQRIAGKRRRHL